jgi:hypothetical protein
MIMMPNPEKELAHRATEEQRKSFISVPLFLCVTPNLLADPVSSRCDDTLHPETAVHEEAPRREVGAGLLLSVDRSRVSPGR